jgi:hypothetical protein
MLGAHNLSDVASAATSLANIGGIAKAGGTMTGALTLAADPTAALQAATKQYVDHTPALNDVGRNLLHNSLFNVQQRGAGPWTTSGAYMADRWQMNLVSDTMSASLVAMADADRSQIGDEAAITAWQNVFTGNAAAGAYNYIIQAIESVRRLGGKTVTVSFWAKAAAGTPKIGINMFQYFGTGGSPSATVLALTVGLSVTLGTSWSRYTATIALPSTAGKTLGTNGNDFTGLELFFSSGATANANAGNIGVQSGTIQLWGMQLEIGSGVTPLEKPDPQQDLAKCQRFYQIGSGTCYVYGPAGYGTPVLATFATTMRAAPTVTQNLSSLTNVTSGTPFSTPSAINLMATLTALGAGQFNYSYTASADF